MVITEKQLELLHRAKRGEERKIVEQKDPPLVVYWHVPPGVLVPFGGGNLRACMSLATQATFSPSIGQTMTTWDSNSKR
jgi:hypothetical protein